MARPKPEIEAEIARLKQWRKARYGKPGLAANVSALDERLAECEAELANG